MRGVVGPGGGARGGRERGRSEGGAVVTGARGRFGERKFGVPWGVLWCGRAGGFRRVYCLNKEGAPFNECVLALLVGGWFEGGFEGVIVVDVCVGVRCD